MGPSIPWKLQLERPSLPPAKEPVLLQVILAAYGLSDSSYFWWIKTRWLPRDSVVFLNEEDFWVNLLRPMFQSYKDNGHSPELPLLLNDIFSGNGNPDWHVFFFRHFRYVTLFSSGICHFWWKVIYCHSPLCNMFFPPSLSRFSFFFSNFTVICLGVVFLYLSSLGFAELPGPVDLLFLISSGNFQSLFVQKFFLFHSVFTLLWNSYSIYVRLLDAIPWVLSLSTFFQSRFLSYWLYCLKVHRFLKFFLASSLLLIPFNNLKN